MPRKIRFRTKRDPYLGEILLAGSSKLEALSLVRDAPNNAEVNESHTPVLSKTKGSSSMYAELEAASCKQGSLEIITNVCYILN